MVKIKINDLKTLARQEKQISQTAGNSYDITVPGCLLTYGKELSCEFKATTTKKEQQCSYYKTTSCDIGPCLNIIIIVVIIIIIKRRHLCLGTGWGLGRVKTLHWDKLALKQERLHVLNFRVPIYCFLKFFDSGFPTELCVVS